MLLTSDFRFCTGKFDWWNPGQCLCPSCNGVRTHEFSGFYLDKRTLKSVQWLTTVIPGTQEAEIGKIIICSQLGGKVSETPSQPINWICWHVPVIPATWEIGGIK
jgi:hypothetical protein